MINNNTRPRRRSRSWGTAALATAALLMASTSSSSGRGVANAFSELRPVSRMVSSVSRRPMSSTTDAPASLSTERLDLRAHQGTLSVVSPLDMVCNDQHEFELSVGHAMDVLRTDYPSILTANPDFTIYDENLELIDPSGVQLNGVQNYRAAFGLVHAIVRIFYCSDRSGLTFRMCFDKARQNIRVHWNAQMIPKALFGGYKTTLHVDGISVYEISRNSGNITQHRIERLVINDSFVMPEKGILAALRGFAVNSDVDGVPAFNAGLPAAPTNHLLQNEDDHIMRVPFQSFSPFSRSMLFSGVNPEDDASRLSMMESSSAEGSKDFDALEKKNLARKKFGLKPLSPEEFANLQEQVAELDMQQQKRAAAAAAEMAERKAKEENPGFLKKLFGNVLDDTCESNYDCERPEVCCDFGFKKMCCSSGMYILDGPPRSREGQLAEVPVIANPGPNYPPDPRQRGNRF